MKQLIIKKIPIVSLFFFLFMLTFVKAQATHGINLTWNASTTSGVTYNVYRATVSGGPYTKINTSTVSTLSFFDSTGIAGQTYFYVVTSILNGIESVDSTQASAVFPLVPTAPTGLVAIPQ